MPRREAVTRPTKKVKASPDWWLLLATLLLIAIGVIMVFSSSQYFAQYKPYNDVYYFLKKQMTNAAVGGVALLFAYKVNYHLFRKLSYTAFLVVLGLLVFMVASQNIDTIGGAQRWLTIAGQNFQPSELAKIALPMVMAKWCTDNLGQIRSFKHGFVPAVLLTGLTAGLILAQKDLSSSLVVAMAGVIILFCAGARFTHFLSLIGVGLTGVAAAIYFAPYRLERVYAWLDPWGHAQDEGWQTVQSLMAIGSGGLTGVGLGAGGSKWYYLPERHTDFIFSVLCEEMGFLGALFVLALICFILWRGIMIAVKAPNTYFSLLAIGLIGSIGVQSVINLGVCTGLLPVTGITLPFVSYGGTSLVVSMTMIGMLLNISRYTQR